MGARGRGEVLGAVDFGSREVRVVIARKEDDGTIRVLGHGTAPGRGCVSQGVVQDLGAAQMALKRALNDAEREARIHVTSLVCGINGRNVETFIREEKIKLEREIVEPHHIEEVLEIASRDVLEAGKHVICSVTGQEWYVDEQRVIDPEGMRGHVLKIRAHFARMPAVIEDNLTQLIESQKRELEDVVFLPLAASLGCLTPEDTELGVALLDMGRSTTGLAVHRDRRILGTQCFEWGGYHITRDVAAGLHVSFDEADELILEYGISDDYIAKDGAGESTLASPRVAELQRRPSEIKLKSAVYGAPSIVPRDDLDAIVYERARELIIKVRQHLSARGMTRHLVRGIVLTGGAARIKNYTKLAESIFETPARVGVPQGIETLPQATLSPEYSGVVGIARHGFDFRTAARNGRVEPRGAVAVGAKRIGRAFRKYFF